MLRTVNYCKMLSDDNPIKTMPIHVFRCFLLFVSFLFVPGICRNRCLLSYAKYRNIFANAFLQLSETKRNNKLFVSHVCKSALWHYDTMNYSLPSNTVLARHHVLRNTSTGRSIINETRLAK